MKPSILKLQKFFKLESERGYDDRAVLGGLFRIFSGWEAEARADNLPEELIQAIASRLRDYQHLSPDSRQEALQGLWRRIQEETDTSATISPAPSRTKGKGQAEKRVLNKPEALNDVIVESEPEEAAAYMEGSPLDDQSAPSVSLETDENEQDTRTDTPEEQSYETTLTALNAPVTVIPGIGPRHGQTLAKLGLETLGDMLYYYPRRYDDYSILKQINRLWYGEKVTVIGTIQSLNTRKVRNGRSTITEAIVSDGSGALRITWFNPWISKRLRSGMQIVLSGKTDQYLGRLVMNNPEWEPLESQNLSTLRIVPVYPLTANITQRWLRGLLRQVVAYWAPRLQDPLPPQVIRSASLMDLSTAIIQTHFPDNQKSLEAARHRLAFDEIFMLTVGMLKQKRAWQGQTAQKKIVSDEWLTWKISTLPFTLTTAQQRALDDVRVDLANGHPMNRLLQGDVGSGKTVIAAMAIAMVVQAGSQAAIMAPTSILAEQHYQSLLSLLCSQTDHPDVSSAMDEKQLENDTVEIDEPALENQPVIPNPDHQGQKGLRPEQIRLLIGDTPDAEKRLIQSGLASGEIKVVIGTHALIEDPVIFQDLQLVIVDEQHRFGVEQRAALRKKGANPHLLVMTATPIPRSLALTVYGDLDLSIIDEMPPGRQVVGTYVLSPRLRERAYSLIRRELNQGRQAFIIYPLVEEGTQQDKDPNARSVEEPLNQYRKFLDPEIDEVYSGKAAVDEYQRLQTDIFPEFNLGLLHGRLKPDEKEQVMTSFRNKEYHLLVSTTVVEVGVDIPNATVMLVEGANRFGLAQLHQLRGRVGRGQEKAYCLLIPESEDHVENERLAAMTETNDGFVLAEKDLQQRGPGDFLGTRQSGFAELKMANLADARLIAEAHRIAPILLDRDPDLQLPENRLLAGAMKRFWGESGDIS
jgi:ATP-dependent DNA helicase RecG